jgi:hypothetical protein
MNRSRIKLTSIHTAIPRPGNGENSPEVKKICRNVPQPGVDENAMSIAVPQNTPNQPD